MYQSCLQFLLNCCGYYLPQYRRPGPLLAKPVRRERALRVTLESGESSIDEYPPRISSSTTAALLLGAVNGGESATITAVIFHQKINCLNSLPNPGTNPVL